MQWDGKSTDYLLQTYLDYQSADFINVLLPLLSDSNTQTAATWLLKQHREQHGSLAEEQLTETCQSLADLHSWQSELHVLQLLPGHHFNEQQRSLLEPFIRNAICSDNKFVRAWAYNALHELALQFTDLQADARDIIACARRDEAPSVKARLRHLKPFTAE